MDGGGGEGLLVQSLQPTPTLVIPEMAAVRNLSHW